MIGIVIIPAAKQKINSMAELQETSDKICFIGRTTAARVRIITLYLMSNLAPAHVPLHIYNTPPHCRGRGMEAKFWINLR